MHSIIVLYFLYVLKMENLYFLYKMKFYGCEYITICGIISEELHKSLGIMYKTKWCPLSWCRKIVGSNEMIILFVNSMASLLVKARECLVMYVLGEEQDISCYEITFTVTTYAMTKGVRICEWSIGETVVQKS